MSVIGRNIGVSVLASLLVGIVAADRAQAQPATDDIIWQNVSGQVHYWPMQNGQRQGGIDVATPVGREWTIVGAGDVD